MKATCFLIFNRQGVESVRKNLPALSNGQYAVRLRVEVPDEVFKPDVRTVDISIEPPQVIAPSVVVEGASAPVQIAVGAEARLAEPFWVADSPPSGKP